MKGLMDALYIAWVIGTKDILDAMKNKYTRTNIVLMIGMVVFFYWFGSLRPFDKDVSVVVYDEDNGRLALEKSTLEDGATYSFQSAPSLQDMESKMANRNLGLVLPADLDRTIAAGGTPILRGYIFWVDRMKMAELEAKYSENFSEILAHPVQVVIGNNIVIPSADVEGMQTTVASQMVYFVFMVALLLIPHLMLEEKTDQDVGGAVDYPGQCRTGCTRQGAGWIFLHPRHRRIGAGPVFNVHCKLASRNCSLPGICIAGHRFGIGDGQFCQIPATIRDLDGGGDPFCCGTSALLHGTQPESRHTGNPDLVPDIGTGQPFPLLVQHWRYSGAVFTEPGNRNFIYCCGFWTGCLESAPFRPVKVNIFSCKATPKKKNEGHGL